MRRFNLISMWYARQSVFVKAAIGVLILTVMCFSCAIPLLIIYLGNMAP